MKHARDEPGLRVGLVGFGYASQTFHAPLIGATPGLRLVAVSSRDAARVRAALGPAVAVDATPEVLIARDLDLLVIPSPNDSHHPLTRAALLAGHDVLVDKPFTLDAAQAQDLCVLARERGRLLSVFHNRRWDGDFMTVRELMRAGTLGRLRHAALHFDRFRPAVRERWREGGGPGSGLWLDLGAHLVDQALQLFGLPLALHADIATLRDGGRADDWFHAQLRYADGLRVHLTASMLAALPGPHFALHGTLGSCVKYGLDTQEDALKAGQRPDPAAPADWGHDPQPGALVTGDAEGLRTTTLPTQRGDYPAFYAALRDALLGRGPNPVPAVEALQVMQVLDLGRRSAELGRELPLE